MNTDFDLILFDLDGTLTDSSPGIANSAEYALKCMNFPVPPRQTFRKFIGPPLWYSFVTFCGMTDEQAEQAVGYYRETYNVKGAFENAPYPGMLELLDDLRAAGFRLAVATSKPESIALPVLDYFKLTPRFDFISAPGDNEHDSSKTELIRTALNACKVPKERAVMIGDTKYDAAGAREAGTDFIGALYGFGSREEMEQEGFRTFARDVEELKHLLLQ